MVYKHSWLIMLLIFLLTYVVVFWYSSLYATSPEVRFTDVQKIIKSNCLKCHENIRLLKTYEDILKYVKSGNSSNSKIYKQITTDDKHKKRLKDKEKEIIKKWIDFGAKNN